MAETIPGPRALPILGNMLDMRNEEGTLKALENLADIYGEVYKLSLGGKNIVCVSSAELLKVFTDEKQFVKTPPTALDNSSGPRSLFLARSDDEDWGQAHRILMPAFGPLSVEGMFDGMKDIAFQLVLKWAREGEDKDILLTDDFTRLTLDTIALCAMDFRFNSFYTEAMHPFVEAMNRYLGYSGKKANRPAIVNKVFGSAEEQQYKEDQATMDRVAKQVIDRRRANPVDKQDLLNTMLYKEDPKTGARMRDELITTNMITFLIAGHETTSGLLSFAFMNLMHNPKAYLAAQREVDNVIGTGAVTEAHLKKLPYLNAVFRETLRLTPTAPAISKAVPTSSHDDYVTICDGRYLIKNTDTVRLLLGKAMRDPSYFGMDAEDFRPERMLEDNPDFDHYMKAWKPFGNGSRSCIGQSFAWQEALLVTALVLQNFDMNFVDPGYRMLIQQNLTVKPKDLHVKIRLRPGLNPTILAQRLQSGQAAPVTAPTTDGTNFKFQASPSSRPGLQILFGSNSGTCQALASKLASTAAVKLGIDAAVRDLDSGVDNLSTKMPVVLITSSYEGQPPDNAARFITWLEDSKSQDLEGVKYAVFGCGHKDWHETFHRIPELVDTKLEGRGASRIKSLGTSDVSQGHVLDDFENWQSELIQKLQGSSPDSAHVAKPDLAEVSTDKRAQQLSSGLSIGTVKDIKILTASDQPEKRHMEIELPADSVYEIGDYLAVLPVNPDDLVRRIMRHWSLPRDATITLKTSAFGSLPVNIPLSIHELLKGYFELSQPVSKSNIQDCKYYTIDPDTLSQLDKLLSEDVLTRNVSDNHTSLLALLERYPTIKLPFPNFLASLLPLHIRQYSISSSPMHNLRTCTITYSVLRHPTESCNNAPATTTHEGVASTYLSTLSPGDTLHLAIKRTATANLLCPFRLPLASAQSTTPLLMFCAGTGLAPFRGFVQQRAIMLQSNPDLKLAPAILFFGCRTAARDRLYADEFDAWSDLGAVDVRYAFSQEPEHAFAQGCRYIGDRILKDMDDVRDLWKSGARVYVCGSRSLQGGVEGAVKTMFEKIADAESWSEEKREERDGLFKEALAKRAVSDIFD